MDDQALLSFGLWIKRRRKALDLTQDALAALVGCSKDLIVKIEGDARRPSREIAARLSTHLQLAPEERDAFIRCARAELAPDRLPAPTRSVLRPRFARVPVPPIPAGSPRDNLPAEISSFVGREQEIADLRTLLARADVRLITLTGSGGTGKTRLALRVAALLTADYPDGIWFVDLAPVSDPQLVISTVIIVLGLADLLDCPPHERLIGWLRGKSLLLLLDNFEQVTEAALLVTDILRAAPHVCVLVTSRVPLRLTGEQEYPVAPLALLNAGGVVSLEALAQYAAIRLFLDRARAIKPDFQLTTANAPAVVEICVRLDGLPLAIELAAARIRIFSPEMLLIRLQQSTLPTLADGARNLPARQQTIKATIDWSYRLLTSSQQRLFLWLGVFVGGWTLEAAEAVCAEVGLDVAVELQALVEHSLVWVVDFQGTPRYTMLETVRAYALDGLLNSKQDEIVRQRYAAYFVDIAEQAELLLKGPESLMIRAALLQELGNLRAVIVWSIDSDQHAVVGLRLFAALLDSFFRNEGYVRDAASWFRALETRMDATTPIRLRARVLWSGAYCLRLIGETHGAQTLYEASLGLFREAQDFSGCAGALNHLGYMAHSDGDIPRALVLQTESLALAQQGEDLSAKGWALLGLGQLARDSDDLIGTQERYNASLRCFELIGHVWSIAVIRFFLADILYCQGRLDAALRAFQELLPLFATTETRGRYSPQTNFRLAQIVMAQGDLVAAEIYAAAALELWRERRLDATAETLRLFGMIALRANMHQQAEQYFQQSLAEATHMQEIHEQLLAMRALSVIARYRGNLAYAAQLLGVALRGFAAQANTVATCWVIEQWATLSATRGRLEYAARLWGAAAAWLAKTTNPIWDSDYIDVSEQQEQVRTTLTADAFDAAYAAGQALSLEQAVAEALGDSEIG